MFDLILMESERSSLRWQVFLLIHNLTTRRTQGKRLENKRDKAIVLTPSRTFVLLRDIQEMRENGFSNKATANTHLTSTKYFLPGWVLIGLAIDIRSPAAQTRWSLLRLTQTNKSQLERYTNANLTTDFPASFPLHQVEGRQRNHPQTPLMHAP